MELPTARQTWLCVTAGPHGARGGKESMDQKQHDKFGDYNQREANSVQKASRTSRWAVLHGGEESASSGVSHRSWSRDHGPRVSNTDQPATDVNSSARTTSEEQTTSAARISRWENILTQVTLTPGFLLPKTCLYFSLYPEDITGPQKGESPFLVTSVFLLSVLYLSRES